MNRIRQRPLSRALVRPRAGVVAVALMLALGVMVPDGAPSSAAELEPLFSSLLSNDDFAAAERGAPTAADHDAAIVEVIALTNVERAAVGLPPLVWNTSLDVAALAHANDQRNVACQYGSLTHKGSDGSNGGERILRTGLDIRRWGENIGCAHKSPASIVRGWMRSPGHRANIMNEKFTQIGAAVAESDSGQLYWVQMFATMR